MQKSLARSLTAQSLATVDVAGISDEYFHLDRHEWDLVSPKDFPCVGPSRLAFSPQLSKYLHESDADIIHLQALWLLTSLYTSRWKAKMKKPSLITPNGMLEPWALRNSAIRKRIAWILFEGKNLHSANCLQANTIKELQDFRALGLMNPVCVIPNGVDLPLRMAPGKSMAHDGFLRILSLGRIHKKKGIDHLLRGISLWKTENLRSSYSVQLVIAGRDDGKYLEKLIELADELKLNVGYSTAEDLYTPLDHFDVLIIGPTYGDQKNILFDCSDVFALPSLSEGQPMAALDGLAHGKPLMITAGCNLNEAVDCGAAVQIDANFISISLAIKKLYEMSSRDREAMGQRGRELVEKKFTWESVSYQMFEVYSWLCGGGQVPISVVLD